MTAVVHGGEQAPAKGTEQVWPGLRGTWCVCEQRGSQGSAGIGRGREQLLHWGPWQEAVRSMEATRVPLELFVGAWEADGSPVWWMHCAVGGDRELRLWGRGQEKMFFSFSGLVSDEPAVAAG